MSEQDQEDEVVVTSSGRLVGCRGRVLVAVLAVALLLALLLGILVWNMLANPTPLPAPVR